MTRCRQTVFALGVMPGGCRKYKKCCDTVPLDPARRPTPTDGFGMAQAFELDVSMVRRIERRFDR